MGLLNVLEKSKRQSSLDASNESSSFENGSLKSSKVEELLLEVVGVVVVVIRSLVVEDEDEFFNRFSVHSVINCLDSSVKKSNSSTKSVFVVVVVVVVVWSLESLLDLSLRSLKSSKDVGEVEFEIEDEGERKLGFSKIENDEDSDIGVLSRSKSRASGEISEAKDSGLSHNDISKFCASSADSEGTVVFELMSMGEERAAVTAASSLAGVAICLIESSTIMSSSQRSNLSKDIDGSEEEEVAIAEVAGLRLDGGDG